METPAPRASSQVMRLATGLVGVALVGVGGWLTLRPFASLAVLLLLVVAGLLLAAGGELADRRPGTGSARWPVTRALVFALAAVAVVVLAGVSITAVIRAVGLALVVGGGLDLLEARDTRGVDRWNAVLGGVASCVFGVLVLAWPDVSVVVVGVLVGVRLVILGVRLVGQAVSPRRDPVSPRPARRWPVVRLAGNVLALALAVVLVATSFAIRRGAPTPDEFYDAPDEVPAAAGQLLRAEPYTREIPDGASAWRILYTTTRDEGQPAVASGLVVVPTDQAGDGIPVVAWAHGTTGVVPGCAPTVIDPFEAGAFFTLDRVLDNGWAFVATDYVGLGTQGPHPYLIGQGEARSVLDAARAARQLQDVRLGDDTVVWGHSQGGHAALWTGMLAPDYAPELSVAGVAALAPASNLPALVDSLDSVDGGELFASFVVEAYTSIYPELTYRELVRPATEPVVRAMAGRCLADLPNTLVSVATLRALDTTLWRGEPNQGAFAERLRQNVPDGPIEAPLLIGQGADDSLVVPAAQDAYVEQRCQDGQQVDYRTYAGRDHVPLVEPDSPAVDELVTWTQERLAGAEPRDTCPEVLAVTPDAQP